MLTPSAYLLPSVPTMLIDEQRGDVTEMIEAVQAAGAAAFAAAPEALVVVTARWVSPGPFHADDSRQHRSVVDLPEFGVEPRYDCAGHPQLARSIVEHATRVGVRATAARHGTDSGVGVPLHFFTRGHRVPVVPLSLSDGTPAEHRAWGGAIRAALEAWHERIAFLVGGAIAWNLHANRLRRDVAECDELLDRTLGALRRGAWAELEPFAVRLAERARPEAGLRHLEVLRGFLRADDENVTGTVLELERSPGIGTALVEFALARPHGGAGR
jgi:aromatic ring-opening dioxygenase catalytic subunit (LigB family)